MDKDHILVVDASPLIYACFDAVGHLSTSNGTPTGVTYGFLRAVRSYREKTGANKVVITYDCHGTPQKATGHQTYKANRTFTEEKAKMWAQVPLLKQTIGQTNWSQIEAPGYEADDLIGAIVRAKAPRGHRVTISSTDNDLCQLIGPNVDIFVPGKAKEKTKDHFKDLDYVTRQFGTKPETLLLYRALAGDKSDNLQPAVELKANLDHARAELNTWSQTRPMTLDDLKQGPLWPYLNEREREVAEQNYHLMELHRPPDDLIQLTKGAGNPKALEDVFQTLEFKSMTKFIPDLTGTMMDRGVSA
jgi:hypothetical protein